MFRRCSSSRFVLLLTVLGLLGASVGATPNAAMAQMPVGDVFVVTSDPGSDGVGGQFWSLDSSITVQVFDQTSVLQATVTTTTPPDPASNYWWGVNTGIDVLPGWTVTATGDQSGYSVSTVATDVVVDGWDNLCTVYGTTTYDPSSLRVDVYDPVNSGRNVTWTLISGVYNWTADFCQPPSPEEFGAAVDPNVNPLVDPGGQAIHHDGSLGATMYHYGPFAGGGEPGPERWFSVEPPYLVWAGGEGWPVGATVNLTVDSDYDPGNGVLHAASAQVASWGPQPWEQGFNFDLGGVFEILVGHIVTITSDFDGDAVLEVDKTLEVADLGPVAVDPATGIVSGTAVPGTWINVSGGNEFGQAWRDVQADGTGYFEANLAIPSPGEQGTISVPFPDGTGGAAQIFDPDSDSTNRGWCIGCGGGAGPGPPGIDVTIGPSAQGVGGWGFEPGQPITVTLDVGGDGSVDHAWIVPDDFPQGGIEFFDNGSFHLPGRFAPELSVLLEIAPGDLVTASDGVSLVEHTVQYLEVTAVDHVANTVTGLANPGTVVRVMSGNAEHWRTPQVEGTVAYEGGGTWTATFADLLAGAGGAASVDVGNNHTAWIWGAPFVVAGIDVGGPTGGSDATSGAFWFFDQQVSVTVTDGVSGIVKFGPQVFEVTQLHWGGFGDTALQPPTDLAVGDLVEAVGMQTNTTVSHTILDLSVTGWEDYQPDGIGNAVHGTATPSGPSDFVKVEVYLPDDPQAGGVRFADVVGGSWTVDFDNPPAEGESAVDVQIGPGVTGIVQLRGPNGNMTFSHWGEHLPQQALIGEFGMDTRVHGVLFEGYATLEVRVTNDPSCTGVVAVSGDFEVEGQQLCNGDQLQPGHNIGVFTPQGDPVRDLTLHDVVITHVDPAADTVSGTGTIGVSVEVEISSPGAEPAESPALRYAAPSPVDGSWTVWFNAPPDLGLGEFGQMEIDDQKGAARQFENDGDHTSSSWYDAQAGLFINPLEDFVILQSWPAEAVTVSVYDTVGGVVLADQAFQPPGPYFIFETWSGIGDLDLVTGYHVVAQSASLTLEHTIRPLAIDRFDFDLNRIEGRASPGATMYIGAENSTGEWEMGLTADPAGDWLADFGANLVFGTGIAGGVAELDGPAATVIFFEARRVTETVPSSGGTVSSGSGGVVEVDVNVPTGGTVSIVTSPATGGQNGFALVGNQITVQSDVTGTIGHPLILTFQLLGAELPPGEDETTIMVFKDGVLVPECVPIPASVSDFPCVSSRIRDLASGDVSITVQTLTLSSWTLGYQALVMGEITAPLEPIAVGQLVTANLWFEDRAGSLDETVTWQWGDDTETTCTNAVSTPECAIDSASGSANASHTYDAPGVYVIAARIINPLGSDEIAEFKYAVIFNPNGRHFHANGEFNFETSEIEFGIGLKYGNSVLEPDGEVKVEIEIEPEDVGADHEGDDSEEEIEFESESVDWLWFLGDWALAGGTMIRDDNEDDGTATTIYGFSVSAFDDPAGDEGDRIRIKIWLASDPSVVVFDSQPGDGSFAFPVTFLKEGKIKIRAK